jgi:hypothetical protein
MTFVLEINTKLKKNRDLNKIIKWEQFKILSNRLIFHRSSYNYPSGVWKREFFYIEKIRFVLKRSNMFDAPCIMISLSLP